MRFGIDTAQHQLTWEELRSRVRFAEDAGFDGAWVFDHFKPLYADPNGPCLEAWTVLAALAGATTRIRLGALVTGVTYRHPSLLAAEAATVDQISSGRLELTLGAAWFEQEHRELGFAFPGTRERAERLEEAVQVIALLLTEDKATFEGRHYTLESATYRPRPVQQPRPPIWIGASGEQLMLPIVGRRADVWHAYGDAQSLKRKAQLVERHAAEAGRDPSEILKSTSVSLSQSMDGVRRDIDAYRALGFGYIVANWPGEGLARVEEFVEKVLPDYAA